MKFLSYRILAALTAIFCFHASEAVAQIGYTARTAEWHVATSDLALRAKIVGLRFEPFLREGSNEPGKHSRLATVLIDVSRCYKGKTDESIKLKVEESIYSDRLERWKEEGIELFWFLDYAEIDERGIRRIVPSEPTYYFQSILEPPQPKAEEPPIMALNVEFEPLTTEAMLEETIVEYVKQFGDKETKGTRIYISKEVARLTGRSGDANVIMLPANYEEIKSKKPKSQEEVEVESRPSE